MVVDSDAFVVFCDEFVEAVERVRRGVGRDVLDAGHFGELKGCLVSCVVGAEAVDAVSTDGHVALGQFFVHLAYLDFVLGDREVRTEELNEVQAKFVGLFHCTVHAKPAEGVALNAYRKATVFFK